MMTEERNIIVLVNDITILKEVEAYAQNERSRFFSSVAHELRTPLNSILPMSKKVKDMVKCKQTLKYLDIIINSASHLANVIEDALDLSRIENNRFEINIEYVNIRSLIEEVSSIMEFQISRKNLKYEVKIDSSIPSRISTDPKRYKQILFNLIGNALKFTFKGGITIKVRIENSFLITDCIDSGVGIGEADLKKLFKAFGRLDATT